MGWPGPMTARQFSAWQLWLREDMDRPDKVCHYLMQATEVMAIKGVEHPDWNPERWRMNFVTESAPLQAPQPSPSGKWAADVPDHPETDREMAARFMAGLGLPMPGGDR